MSGNGEGFAEEFATRVLDRLAERGESMRSLALRAGMHPGTLWRKLAKLEGPITVDEFFAIARALDCDDITELLPHVA